MAFDPGLLTSSGFTVPSFSSLTDAELLQTQRSLAETRRRADALAAALAAEVAHRSRPELGYDGLAVRLGARTPAILVQQVTGVSAREANALVRVGAEMGATPNATTGATPVGAAVGSGSISVDAAHAIRVGLGSPADSITAEMLEASAVRLLSVVGSVTVEKLASLARDARAELDLTAIADHEQALRDKRTFHVWRRPDGMIAAHGLFAPEDGAILLSAYDAATSPRRGGPRFVSSEGIARTERLLADERTTEQIAADAFIELVRMGGTADDGAVLGAVTPAVQLIVTDHDLRARAGLAHIEGQSEPVSIQTVERAICESGAVPIRFDSDGRVIDIGRTMRLYTARQRIGLAARDGGCRFPGCDRPPSWCEAHHLVEWARGGRTDLADGILLCRHHHMLVHNNGWRVTRTGVDYFVVPPMAMDPKQVPIPAPSRSRTVTRALA